MARVLFIVSLYVVQLWIVAHSFPAEESDCGDGIEPRTLMDVNGRRLCTNCPVDFFYTGKGCERCNPNGSRTNMIRNLRRSCKDLRPTEPPKIVPTIAVPSEVTSADPENLFWDDRGPSDGNSTADPPILDAVTEGSDEDKEDGKSDGGGDKAAPQQPENDPDSQPDADGKEPPSVDAVTDGFDKTATVSSVPNAGTKQDKVLIAFAILGGVAVVAVIACIAYCLSGKWKATKSKERLKKRWHACSTGGQANEQDEENGVEMDNFLT